MGLWSTVIQCSISQDVIVIPTSISDIGNLTKNPRIFCLCKFLSVFQILGHKSGFTSLFITPTILVTVDRCTEGEQVLGQEEIMPYTTLQRFCWELV